MGKIYQQDTRLVIVFITISLEENKLVKLSDASWVGFVDHQD